MLFIYLQVEFKSFTKLVNEGVSNIKNYKRNCCRIAISQSVCQWYVLPPQRGIFGQFRRLPLGWSPMSGSTFLVSSLAHRYQAKVEVNGSGKHLSLILCGNHYVRKKFCNTSCSWGLFYKTYYGHNFSCIAISQSVCHCHSLSPQSNISSQGQSLSKSSPLQDSTLIAGSQPCPAIIRLGWK